MPIWVAYENPIQATVSADELEVPPREEVPAPDGLPAAEYGHLCCHQLTGEQIWAEKLWSNAGDMAVAGDGETILLAGFNHGIQLFDGQGTNRGAFVVEGTPNRVSMSFLPTFCLMKPRYSMFPGKLQK